METKMHINSKIEKNFLFKVYEIVLSLDFEKGYATESYENISQINDNSEKIFALRTKLAYLILKLYNTTITNTFKLEKIIIDKLNSVIDFKLGHPLTNECFKLFTENILFANNVILNRLDINKS